MRKRLLSLCMALALCLTLFPATALAAAENAPTTLYVGNYQITNNNATTYFKAGSTQGSLVGGSENDWTVKYAPSTATLTLNGATITGNDNISSVPYGAGIYAQCNSGQPVTLTIELIGENIITGNYGIYVNAEMSANSYGTDASLNITGNGSLIVTGTNSHGLFVKSGTGNASLTINDASVVAKTTYYTSSGYAGVYVQSSMNATSSPQLSLKVNGGSLTASGGDGISFNVGSSGDIGATTSLTISDNAIVRAENGINAYRVDKPTLSGTGIVFDGTEGTVYGNVTLQEDLEISEGESLTLDSGASLDAGDYDVIVDGGTLDSTLATNLGESVIYKVTKVELDKTSLELTEGGTARLTATILPDNATNKNVTWSTSDASIATVTDGVVTAVAPGTATITVTTEDGGKTATCAVTVAAATVPVTGVTLNKTSTSLYVGDTETLTATVAPDNATDRAVNWTSSNPSVATVENGVVTAVGAGTATITVTTQDNDYTASCTVTVSRYSSGGGSSSSSTSLSDRAIDDIQDARPGDTVEITLRPGRTTLEREVFEELAGQDITLEIDAGDGVLWTVNGLDIPEDTRLHDLDLDVDLGDSGIPATVLNAVTGEISTVQLSLAHDGQFGFTMTLSAPLGRDNADYWANLYWFNERTDALEFQQAARIARDGTAEFALNHASDYAIVIDNRSHEPVDLPFTDVPEGYWAYDAIQYVYGEGLMAGTSGSAFSPEGTTTRGQIVTILWRLSGSPVVNYLMDFDDVDPAAYYGEAIRWATSEGIAGGYGGGVFGPNDPITREQLAVMLYRYAQHEGYDVSIGEDTNILSYADAFTVSEYAVSALQWACGAGIISGTGDGSTLTPQGETTRAQVATVLMRFCEQYQ